MTAATEENDAPPYEQNAQSGEWDQFPLPADNPYNSADEKDPLQAKKVDVDADWDTWPAPADHSSTPDDTSTSTANELRALPPPPLHQVKPAPADSLPPPPMHHVPPPTPDTPNSPGSLSALMKRPPRPSRYVVTGTKVTSSEPSALAPPRPPEDPQRKAHSSPIEPPQPDEPLDEPLPQPLDEQLDELLDDPFESVSMEQHAAPPEPVPFLSISERPAVSQPPPDDQELVVAAFGDAEEVPFPTADSQENKDISREKNFGDLQYSTPVENFVDEGTAMPTDTTSSQLEEENNRLKNMYSSIQTVLGQKDAELQNLKNDFHLVRTEKDTLLFEKERADEENAVVRREALELRDRVDNDSEELYRTMAERDAAHETIQRLEQQVHQFGQERDSYLAEFENLKDENRNADAKDVEQSSKQIQELRELLERSEAERNEASRKLGQLELRLEHDAESAESRIMELERQMNSLSKNLRATGDERDEALKARDQLLEEQKTILNDLHAQERLVEEKELELENFKRGLKDDEFEKAEEKARLEATSSQIKELEDALERAITERNELHAERESMKNDLEKQRTETAAASSKTDEANRKVAAITAELQESESKSKNLQAELTDLHSQFESLSSERDSLVQQRTELTSGLEDVPATIKTLISECEEKTKAVSALQRQLKIASSKVAKVTAQRNKILRQRDDAGSRLNAAGSEFISMNNKLKNALAANNEFTKTVQKLQNERDEALQKVVELSATAAKVDEQQALISERENRIVETEADLLEIRTKLRAAEDSRRVAENGLKLAEAEVKKLNDMNSIATRELEESRSEYKELADREVELRNLIEKERESVFEAKSALKEVQLEMVSSNQRLECEKEAVVMELSSTKDALSNANAKLDELHVSLQQKNEELSFLRAELETSLRQSGQTLEHLSAFNVADVDLSSLRDVDVMSEISTMSDYAFVQSYGKIHRDICTSLYNVVQKLSQVLVQTAEEDRTRNSELTEKIQSLENDVESLSQDLNLANEQCERLQQSGVAHERSIDENKVRIAKLESDKKKNVEELESSRAQIRKLQDHLDNLSVTLAEERSTRDAFSAEEKEKFEKQIEASSVHVQAIWTILQDVLSSNVLQGIIAESERNGGDESLSSVSLMVIRGARVLSDEVERLRKASAELNQKLIAAQEEIESIWERIELAESERDAARTARDQAEREAVAARNSAMVEASEEAELRIAQLEEQLEHTREDVTILQDSLEKAETENSDLRTTYNELTSEADQTSRQLEDAEENIAYLQDEIAGIKEDLEIKSSELSVSREHCTALQGQLLAVRDEKDKSQNSFREIELVMETHKNAEENLQIAIEQLEAEQETIIERKTQDLQKRLDESISAIEAMKSKVKEADGVLSQLSLRDEEITELRTALGRLSDERVELKLELEKSLSRLNHPDGEGQLIDRRVIRQLLVNYFRVGTARRRDVLELMSRILAFSDSDMVTVGLKRVNLSERIGSLLQPPDLDGNTLPPIGNVSDKWIEFLMKESVEEDDDNF